jgi:hypothetical protein
MYDSKLILGILSSVFVLIGALPYLKDIKHKKAKPQVLSWLGWAFITGLGAVAMLADGATWTAAIVFANMVLCLIIAFYSIVTKAGIWSVSNYDYVFFGLGIVGLILWQILDLPAIAIVFAILADLLFGLPTITKTYKEPSTETPFVWLTAVVSAILSLFAATNLSFTQLAFPFYLLLFDSTVLLLALRVIRSTKIVK